MVAALEPFPSRGGALKSSSLRGPLSLQSGGCSISVDPDGSVRSFDSMAERRALFGSEQLWFYKIQAGVVVQGPRPDWGVRASPDRLQFSGSIFDGVEVSQSLQVYEGGSSGFLRQVRFRNGGRGVARLRLITLRDPTAAHFGDPGRWWGSLGMNAFNRDSHVAMDEVSDPPAARVVGSSPAPSKFFLTSNRSRALDAVSRGELPEGTAGMSGQVLVLSSHELELAPGEAKELAFSSLYSPGKLEEVLAEFGGLGRVEKRARERPLLASSDGSVAEAAAWALPAVEGGAYSGDRLDRYESLRALCYLSPATAGRVIDGAKGEIRRDGSLPHSMDPTKPGVLETAVFLRGISTFILLSRDKKLRRGAYSAVKKLAGYLLALSKESVVSTDPSLPQGWRRALGRGYPTGEIPEVSLAVAGGLGAASDAARALSKGADAGKFRERAEMISERVRKGLLDERGFLCLCRETSGRVRWDETVDMAVAAYRHPFMRSAEQGEVHRLLEKDFDTPYGPRCVPVTNQVYFNRSYGSGQLGGVWTRASLAQAAVCYSAGLSGLGSIAVAKVARLVNDLAPKMGGSPGEFPRWVDADAGEAHGDGSDPVAAARFVEALLEGDLGLRAGPAAPSLSPPSSSSLRWVLAAGFWAGARSCVFLGRGGGRVHLFVGGEGEVKGGNRFSGWERIEAPAKGVYAVCMHSPGQVVCVASSAPAPVKFTLSFAPKAAPLSSRLSTPLETFDQAKGAWSKSGTLRVLPTMAFEASLGPGEWKAFRVSTA